MPILGLPSWSIPITSLRRSPSMAQPGALMAAEIIEQPDVWRRLLDRGPRAVRHRRRPDRRVRPDDGAVRRPRHQRPRRPVREVPDRDRGSATGRAGLPVHHDRLRRPPRPDRSPDGRGQPVRRLAGPRAVAAGGPPAGRPHPGDHQPAGITAGPRRPSSDRRDGRAGARGRRHQVLHRPAARALPDHRPAARRRRLRRRGAARSWPAR